jgi:hypothetical protein
MLSWFGDDECERCRECGEHASVSLSETPASFCLACGAISIDGKRIDVDRRVADVPC